MSVALLLPGPSALAFGAGRFQEPEVESPLPGGIADVVRFLLTEVPQWVQIAGVFVALAVAVWSIAFLWRRRVAIRQWYHARRRPVQVTLAAVCGLALLGFAAFGAASWNYVQHDNGFCTGCHVMGPAFQRFVQSEHDSLSCHDCHQQSMFASARQLYLWVAERPDEIGPHAKVPSRICAECHITGERKETWQHIAATAGHRTHLESDSSTLRDVQCVTCHGIEVHRFTPVDSTCAQANCHVNVEIAIAKMRDQTDLHCVTCHQFTVEVPALATRDSASGALVPGEKQCFSCHEMRQVLAEFDPARDPHRGTCGMCHNPHEQKTPAEAAQTCATADCHATWRSEPFHTGANHRNVARNCVLCHQPHAATVDASDCAGCHRMVQGRRAGQRRLTPPLPFDTNRALRRTSSASPHRAWVGPFFSDDGIAADTFSHSQHRRLACITCHTTRGSKRLTFVPPRGCQICHHQAPATSNCASCHQTTEIAAPESVRVAVTVTGHPRRERVVAFEHATHRTPRCVDCHTLPVSLKTEPKVAECVACHEDHHTANKQCAACHVSANAPRAPHAPPTEAHVGCDACHTPATVTRLVPDRPMCLSCHQPQRDHFPDRECTICHFQDAPEGFRRHLQKRPRS